MRAERLGLLSIAGAAAAWSTAGLFTRLIHVDTWTLLVWRNVFGGAFMGVVVAMMYRRRLVSLRLSRVGWFAATVNGLSMLAYLGALRETTVAHTVIIYATMPFVAAVLAWATLREAPTRPTLLAAFVALLGVVMAVGSGGSGRFLGDALAGLMTLGVAIYTTVVRAHRDVSLMLAAAVSPLIGATAALPRAHPLGVSAADLALIAVFATTSFALGLALYTYGARHVSPARAGLVSALDTPLAPLWVWLAFGEDPGVGTLIGGAVVLVAVLANLLLERHAGTPAG